MKKIIIIFCFITSLFSGSAYSQSCVSNCTLYTVQSTPYTIQPIGGNFISLGDDQLSGLLNIGFTFTFYCNSYTQFKISSNGFITFDAGATNSGCCSGGFIPGGGTPNNQVAWSWNDLNPSAGGQIAYQTIGTAPNRICVITWTNVPHFGGGAPPCSGQIKLFETSNAIEVHNAVVTSDGSNCTQGIENAAGNIAVPVPGRNGQTWTANSDARRWTVSAGGPIAPGPIMGNVNACPGGTYVYSVTPMAGATSYNWTLPGGWSGSSTSSSISVSPGSTGVLSVSATYTCGTSTTTTLSITMNPAPTVGITGGTTPLCPNQSATLTGTGANTYSWNTGPTAPSIIITPSVSQTYSVIGTSVAGCTAIAMQDVTVTSGPTLTVTGPLSICQGQTAFLNGNGASTYSWSTGSTQPNIAVTPSVNTTYSVWGAMGTCTDMVAVTVTVNPVPVINISGSNTLCAGQVLNLVASGADTYTWNTGDLTPAISHTPGSNYTYIVYGTNTVTGCTGTTSHSVTVNSAPSVTITGPYAMCLGQTITLTAYGATSYSWDTGSTSQSIVVSPTNDTSFTVEGISTLGCPGPPVTKNITVNPIPVITVAATNTFLCKGQTATVTASGVDTYSWSPSGILTASIVVSPSVSSSYTVFGTNTTTGCYNTETISLAVSLCTGIENNEAIVSEILVYPNPNHGEFIIEMDNGLTKHYEVFDMMGRAILAGSGDEDKLFVNIRDFANGVYYVKLQSENTMKVVRIIKQ